MKKDLLIGELASVYGELLTPRQRDVISSYYDYDLSLSEIAENTGVTRQAVRDTIVKACEQLKFYEESVGAVKLKTTVKDALEKSLEQLRNGNDKEATLIISDVLTNL